MEPGEFAVRGSIFDVMPAGENEGFRLDWFGDDVESIKRFDPMTQITTAPAGRFTLTPTSEVLLSDATISNFRTRYRELFGAVKKDDTLYEAISQNTAHSGMEHFLPLFYERTDTIFDYTEGAQIMLDADLELLGATPPGQVRALVDAARGRGLVPEGTPGMTGLIADNEREWAGLIADLDIEARDSNALIGAARRALTVSIAQSGGTIDFMDMLYMPILTDGTTFPRTDLAMVDELQDLDPLQRRMVEMVGAESGGFIGVGDPRQAIFSWRGTGLDAMERVARTMECAALPLSVCYRCPTSHLDLAREYVPQIEAAPGAIAGLVEEHAVIDPARFAAGDVIICRMKAPCVDLAIRLIQAGIPTRVLGRDIAASIEELVRSSGAESVTALVQAAQRRCDRAQARAAKLDDDRALAEAADRQRIIEAIAETCDDNSIATFVRRLRFLFAEEDGAAKVTLCTIHKFKGMQARRVWWLDENLCDENRVKSPMAAQETRNLRYVALTRSTDELHFIYSRDNRDR